MRRRAARWRPALRIARRDALQARGRSALILVMIALPVLMVVALDVLGRTADVSTTEGISRQVGGADARVTWQGETTPVLQNPDLTNQAEPPPTGNQPVTLPVPTARTIAGVLPGARVVEFHQGDLSVRTGVGVSRPAGIGLDLRRPITRGLYDLTSGRYPTRTGEVLVSRRLAQRGFPTGATMTFGDGSRARVVGLVESATSTKANLVVGLPATLPFEAPATDLPQPRTWLVDVPGEVSWTQVQALNTHALFALSRSVVEHPPPPSQVRGVGSSGAGVNGTEITVLALIVAMALLEVVLLAGPAFAVGVKRQERALALMSATGAEPPDVRRVVLASGVVLGTLAGVAGAVLGVVGAWVSRPVVQTFSTERFGPFDLNLRDVAGIAACGLASAVLAALLPAVMASRQDVVAVLAGRRGATRTPVWSPVLGAVLLGLGVAGAVVGARRPAGGEVPITGSAVLSVLGMVLLIPLVVAQLGRLARWLPLPLRFAVRDAARQRSRTAPAVAAVAAVVAGAVALGIGGASDGAQNRATYQAQAPRGAALVTCYDCFPTGSSPDDRWPALQAAVAGQVRGATVHPVTGVRDGLSDPAARPDDVVQTVELRSNLDNIYGYANALGASLLVGRSTLAQLPRRLAAADQARAERVLGSGGVVLLSPTPQRVASVQVVVKQQRYDGSTPPVALGAWRLPATVVVVPGQSMPPAQAILSTAAARRVHLPVSTTALLLTGAAVDQQTEDRAQEAAATVSNSASVYVERGFHDNSTTVALLILGVAGAALVLGGTLTATFLALSDARPDFATMGAVGAAPRTRRLVAAAYALCVGAVGALLGAAVGFIPGVAVTYPLTRSFQPGATAADGSVLPDHFLDVPWLMVLGLVVGLPLLAALVVTVATRSRLPMVSRLT